MFLRMFVPKFYLDRTELPILNEFPLGWFLAFLYVISLPKIWLQVGAGIQSTIPESVLPWSVAGSSSQSAVPGAFSWSAGASIKPTVSACEDEFSKDVMDGFAQADDILTGILADQEPLFALQIIIDTMLNGLSSLFYLHRSYYTDGIHRLNRSKKYSRLELLVKDQEFQLERANKERAALLLQYGYLANITLIEYQRTLAELKRVEAFSNKQSGYVKLRSFLSERYAAQAKHSQYNECRALDILYKHIERIRPIVFHTANMSMSLHHLFVDIAQFPDRLQMIIDLDDPVAEHVPDDEPSTDSEAQMVEVLKHFDNSHNITHWIAKKKGTIHWLPKTKAIFTNGVNAYATRMVELNELYWDLGERLRNEFYSQMWFARCKNARTGVVGCAGKVEKQAEGLAEALEAWTERRYEWGSWVMNRRRIGRGIPENMTLAMLKGVKGGEDAEGDLSMKSGA